MTGRSILRLVPPALVAVGLLAACSDDSGLAQPTSPPVATDPTGAELPGSGTVVEVDAFDNRFEAPAITVQAGTTVRFKNVGRNDHNVLPDEGEAWGVAQADFTPGSEYSATFDTPGTYLYVCTIHGTVVKGKGIGMVGTIEVTAS